MRVHLSFLLSWLDHWLVLLLLVIFVCCNIMLVGVFPSGRFLLVCGFVVVFFFVFCVCDTTDCEMDCSNRLQVQYSINQCINQLTNQPIINQPINQPKQLYEGGIALTSSDSSSSRLPAFPFLVPYWLCEAHHRVREHLFVLSTQVHRLAYILSRVFFFCFYHFVFPNVACFFSFNFDKCKQYIYIINSKNQATIE